MQRKTTEQFVASAKSKHGERYDYSQTAYSTSTTKLAVICPVHGVFWTLPSNHTSGKGCPDCGKQIRGQKKLTTRRTFLERARALHRDQYDYSLVRYDTLADKIDILCRDHGPFRQLAIEHLHGKGCAKCGRLKASRSKTLSSEEFVRKATVVHGSRYDYSATEYTTMHKKVLINCPDHGHFLQKAANHINGNGCPTCRNEGNRKRFSLSQELFLERVRKAYGDSLELGDVKYVNAYKKVALSCPKHGAFSQYPVHLLRGVGCPVCGKARTAEKLKMSTEDFVDKANVIHRSAYTYVGVSFDTLRDSIRINCKRHGHFDQVAFSHLSGAGCPKCKASRGENAIINWLIASNISHVHQWSDHDCFVNTHRAKFDFYLPDFKLIIEFDGAQHFMPIKFGSSISDADALERFEHQQIADFLKDDWASTNGLGTLRIRYDEDVEQMLEARMSTMRPLAVNRGEMEES